MPTFTYLYTASAASQALGLLIYFVSLFATGFVWRSWATYRATGVNPLVLPSADTAHGYIGRAFKVVMLALFVYIGATAAGWLPMLAPLWHAPFWLAALAWFILAAAWGWMLLAQWHMGTSWRIGIDVQRATDLVTHGLFGISRNPIFLSLRCAMLGLWVLLPTAPVLALAIASELLMQIQVRLEETHLNQLHDSKYTQYCHSVRRWLGVRA